MNKTFTYIAKGGFSDMAKVLETMEDSSHTLFVRGEELIYKVGTYYVIVVVEEGITQVDFVLSCDTYDEYKVSLKELHKILA